MLTVKILSVVITLMFFMSVVMQNNVMLIIATLNVDMMSVVMLSVVAPVG